MDLPVEEHRIRGDTRLVYVGDKLDVFKAVEHAQAGWPEQVEEQLGDWVANPRGHKTAGAEACGGESRARIREVLDRLAEAFDEAVAEVADRIGGTRQLVAHQRQAEAADLVVEQVLQALEEQVDAIHAEQQLVEQTEIGGEGEQGGH